MLCKDTLLMVGGGLLAGFGAAQSIGQKKPFEKIEIIGPLIGGIALLGYGYMNYSKKRGGGYGSPPPPPMPDYAKDISTASNTPTIAPQPAVIPTKKLFANYTFPTLNASGNASPSYDYNHIYPGFI